MKFVPRTTAPSSTNKYYLKAGKGGYNRAMEIDSKTHSCLPNCVGLAHARWLESQKQTDYEKYDKLPTGNAENYYTYAKDGYKRGKTPKVGAIVCWRKGEAGVAKDGAGHLAFVEDVYSNGDILTSNSAYGGSRYYTKKYTKASNYRMGTNYTFQGFIYNPVEFEPDDPKKPYSGEFPTLPARGYFKRNDKGKEVKKIQNFLNWANGCKLTEDGIYGDKTILQVKMFQKTTKITQDGLYGKSTLAKAKTFKK